MVYIYTNKLPMPRQSISFTEPNDQWLKDQVASKEYSSKSELINDLVRRARQKEESIEWIRAQLIAAEEGGFTSDRLAEVLEQSRSRLNG